MGPKQPRRAGPITRQLGDAAQGHDHKEVCNRIVTPHSKFPNKPVLMQSSHTCFSVIVTGSDSGVCILSAFAFFLASCEALEGFSIPVAQNRSGFVLCRKSRSAPSGE